VVTQLDLALGEEESRRLQSRDTASPEAMVAYGMGRTAIGRRTAASLNDARRYFEEAVALDPQYVEAYAELANTFALLAEQQPDQRTAHLARAQETLDQAMALDDASGAVWASQGLIHMTRAEADPSFNDRAREALARAIELNPSLPMANMWYGNLMEDPAERQRYHALAFELDPRSPVAGYNLANDLMLAGREAEAMDVFSRIVEADPNYPGAYLLIARMNEYRGRLGEAIRNYEKVYQLQPTSNTAARLAYLWIDIGDFDRAQEWIRRAERDPPPDMRNELRWLRISAAVARGDRDSAETVMQSLADGPSSERLALINTVRASYFLEKYEDAVRAFEALEDFELPETADAALSTDAYETRVAVAWAYQQIGQEDEAERLLREVDAAIQTRIAEHPRVNPVIWFVLAQINAQRGQTNLALIHLQRAVDEGWRQHWRPAVEPNLRSVVMEPAYTAMMQGLATRMDLIREQIAFDESFEQDWAG
jgi:tetratricopeptide (TPR) repeat protein